MHEVPRSAPSRVLQRGDSEILTYETEQDYDRLQELHRQSQESQPEPGVMTPRYYRSDVDGSVQPYAIWLPRDYNSERKYPLVIQLHGTNFKEVLSGSRLTYRGMGEPQWIEPNLPVIYAHCFGGPTTFYQGMGEVDVLKVIDEAKRLFSVDPDRVFIMGHSMGGAGSYTIGLHYPDRFGGIMAGDPASGPKAAVIPPDRPKWMEPQIAIVSPPKLYPNARNVDVFFKNAGEGIQRYSTEFSDGIVAEGGFATVEVLPGMPHSFGAIYHNAAWVTQLIQHPVRRWPANSSMRLRVDKRFVQSLKGRCRLSVIYFDDASGSSFAVSAGGQTWNVPLRGGQTWQTAVFEVTAPALQQMADGPQITIQNSHVPFCLHMVAIERE